MYDGDFGCLDKTNESLEELIRLNKISFIFQGVKATVLHAYKIGKYGVMVFNASPRDGEEDCF